VISVRIRLVLGLILLCLNGSSCVDESANLARFERRVDWIGQGQWLKADTHIHTEFSDGKHPVSEVIARGVDHGCEVLAVTDHADRALGAATPEYAEAIEVARRQHPGLILLAGLEWNVPPWGGDEHATVLVPPGPDEFLQLADFKEKFDDYDRENHDADLAGEALRWLEETATSGKVRPVVIYNHPSRKDTRSTENINDVLLWHEVNDIVVGFSGAPGHQAGESPGDYEYDESTIDRWDPVVARVGDAWDTLLQAGIDVWGARAASDFHRVSASGFSDYWPGQFSETWLYVPERTPEGVLQAFRAGTFFADHGHIVREARLTVDSLGLDRPAEAGEVVSAVEGARLTVDVWGQVPDLDWAGNPNQVDVIELIAVTSDGARVVDEAPAEESELLFSTKLDVPPGGIVLRARGRRVIEDGPDLLFYTNPIRVTARHVATGGEFPWRSMTGTQLLGLGLCALAVVSLAVSVSQRMNTSRAEP